MSLHHAAFQNFLRLAPPMMRVPAQRKTNVRGHSHHCTPTHKKEPGVLYYGTRGCYKSPHGTELLMLQDSVSKVRKLPKSACCQSPYVAGVRMLPKSVSYKSPYVAKVRILQKSVSYKSPHVTTVRMLQKSICYKVRILKRSVFYKSSYAAKVHR